MTGALAWLHRTDCKRGGGSVPGILVILAKMPPAELARLPARLNLEDQRRLVEERRRRHRERMPGLPAGPYPWSPPGREVRLVLPGYLPASINRWGRDRRLRKTEVQRAVEALTAAYPDLLVWPPERRSEELRPFWRPLLYLKFWFSDRRRRDPGNWHKAVVDALVRVGLIRDDSAGVLRLNPEEFFVDRTCPRTEVVLVERGGGECPARG